MSADNGIYILETAGPEFRVIHAQAIENIYGGFDDEKRSWIGDAKMIVEYFGESKVFDDFDEAVYEADKLSTDIDWIEDGICFITDFKDIPFGDFRK